MPPSITKGPLVPSMGVVAMKAVGGALKKLKKLKIAKSLKKKSVKFKAPSKRNFSVVQRTDIDWNMKRKVRHNGKTRIMTNREAALLGKPPVVRINGKNHRVTLHHHNQNPNGPLVEILQSDHSKHHGALHPKTSSRIDRVEFDKDRSAYWKARGQAAPK